MTYGSNIFPEVEYDGPHEHPHVAHGIGRHYNVRMYPILIKGKCKIYHIPWVEKHLEPCTPDEEQPRYTQLYYCIYAQIIGSFSDWDMVTLDNQYTSEDSLYDIHKVIIDGIVSHKFYIVTHGDVGAMTTDYTKKVVIIL